MRGILLANDCGIGKTNTMLASIWMYATDVDQTHAAGKQSRALPSLILEPASVLLQQVRSHDKFWGRNLKAYLFYGTATQCKDMGEGTTFLTESDSQELMDDLMKRSWTDPDVSTNLTRNISSYPICLKTTNIYNRLRRL